VIRLKAYLSSPITPPEYKVVVYKQ